MSSPAHVQVMARYNRWQNQNLYGAADGLSDSQRREDRGAWFGSIHKTLWHILWADQQWMGRFTAKPPPFFDYAGQPWPTRPVDSPNLQIAWPELKRQRAAFDQTIIDWSATVDPAWLGQELRWANAEGRQNSKPHWLLVAHMFNHQTHHRGQVHALLTGLGARPGDTDLPWLVD